MILSRIGIIDLIATVYNGLAYAFLIIYVVPLLTVGVYKIIKNIKNKMESNINIK